MTDIAGIKIEYDRFVWLAARYPGERLVPSISVDDCWHRAIAVGEPDAPAHVECSERNDRAFEITRSLYRAHYGEPGPTWATAAECQTDAPAPDVPSRDLT